jgi:hypothetical protein
MTVSQIASQNDPENNLLPAIWDSLFTWENDAFTEQFKPRKIISIQSHLSLHLPSNSTAYVKWQKNMKKPSLPFHWGNRKRTASLLAQEQKYPVMWHNCPQVTRLLTPRTVSLLIICLLSFVFSLVIWTTTEKHLITGLFTLSRYEPHRCTQLQMLPQLSDVTHLIRWPKSDQMHQKSESRFLIFLRENYFWKLYERN